MTRTPFTLNDLQQECEFEYSHYRLQGLSSNTTLGIKIHVPTELMAKAPYNNSAYSFLQQLRSEVFEYGLIEFPNLPVNRCNHTIAMRAPEQHQYSANPYLTDHCQAPHQDTPPYPTAFWLNSTRRYAATWIMSTEGLENYHHLAQASSQRDTNNVHRQLVAASLENKTGILLNHQPGLLLIDNSEHRKLYHARTCHFLLEQTEGEIVDTPMYAFNEMGLLHYIDSLDERRGSKDRDEQDKLDVIRFMEQENV